MMMRNLLTRLPALGLAVALPLVLVLVPAASAKHAKHHHHKSGGSWSWSKSTITGGKPEIQGLSCTSASLCVASGPVDLGAASGGTNNVFWTTSPGSGTWQTAPLEAAVQPSLSAGPEPIPETSCVGTNFCAIADGFANLYETSDPTGGAGAWAQTIPSDAALVGLSCFSAVCGAIDVSGRAVATTNSVVNSISPVFSDASEGLSEASISCVTGGFCAAVDDGPTFAWTSNLLAGGWQTGNFSAREELGNIDCPSSSLCLISGSKLYVSTNPAAGPSSFKAVKHATPGLISCASSSFCAVTTSHGIEVSTNPASGTWESVKTPFAPGLISCPQAGVCVITGGPGAALGRA